MKLLIKFPTRQRRERFFQSMDFLLSSIKDYDNTDFLISLDADDEEMNNDTVKSHLEFYSEFYGINIETHFGISMNKIHACNRDLDSYKNPWDIVMLMSDDMFPVAYGFDEIIRDVYRENIPDLDGVLYSPDGFTTLNTLCILGKKYYERFNFIYNPVYESFFSDNEFQEVAQMLKKEIYINKVLFRHDHPCNIGVGTDDLYLRNNAPWEKDKALYYERKKNNFYLDKSEKI